MKKITITATIIFLMAAIYIFSALTLAINSDKIFVHEESETNKYWSVDGFYYFTTELGKEKVDNLRIVLRHKNPFVPIEWFNIVMGFDYITLASIISIDFKDGKQIDAQVYIKGFADKLDNPDNIDSFPIKGEIEVDFDSETFSKAHLYGTSTLDGKKYEYFIEM